MVYSTFKQFLDDTNYHDAIKLGLAYPLSAIIRWNNEDPSQINSKIETLITSYIIQDLRQYESFNVLWNEDSDICSVSDMKVSSISSSIITKYSYSLIKIIEGLKYIVNSKNFNLNNVIGAISHSSRNDGYSNFVTDSLSEQNNWSNVISKHDSSTIQDMITLIEYFRKSDLYKISNEIRDNVLVLVYGEDYGY